jgi:hypothetical protein
MRVDCCELYHYFVVEDVMCHINRTKKTLAPSTAVLFRLALGEQVKAMAGNVSSSVALLLDARMLSSSGLLLLHPVKVAC